MREAIYDLVKHWALIIAIVLFCLFVYLRQNLLCSQAVLELTILYLPSTEITGMYHDPHLQLGHYMVQW